MSATVTPKRGRSRRPDVLQKPRGVIHPRVQKVGPERFGIVAVDPAKARSKWMVSDFWGNVLASPAWVEHNRGGFEQAIAALREAVQRHELRDVLVAVERTGRYHHPAQRAFAAGGFEVRTVHPLITRHFRQLTDPGIKTDDKDLGGIALAAINGFALVEADLDGLWRQLRLLVRHRRDLVRKASVLCCQIKEHLESALPGYAACFPTLWEHPAALTLALRVGDLGELRRAGRPRLRAILEQAKVGFQDRTLDRVIEWAKNAGSADVAACHHRRSGGRPAAKRAANPGIGAGDRRIALGHSVHIADEHPRRQRRLGGGIRRGDGADQQLRQQPLHHRSRGPLPGTLSERPDRLQRAIDQVRQPPPAVCPHADRRQPDSL